MRNLLVLCLVGLLIGSSAQAQVGLTGSPAPGQLPGTAAADSANAGNVGQEIISNVAQGSAVSLTNGVVANLTNISLTAGDWDVQCTAQFIPAATTSVTALIASTSLTTAALDTSVGNALIWQPYSSVVNGGGDITESTPLRRFSVSAPTTVFCPVEAFFTTSTLTVWGTLRARRMR